MKIVLQSMTDIVDKNLYIYTFIVTSFSATLDDEKKIQRKIEDFISVDNFYQYYQKIEHQYNGYVGENLKVIRDMITDKYVFQFQSNNYFEKIEYEYNGDVRITCKTTNEKADLLKDYYKSKGYVSANQYLKDLIYKDSGIIL